MVRADLFEIDELGGKVSMAEFPPLDTLIWMELSVFVSFVSLVSLL